VVKMCIAYTVRFAKTLVGMHPASIGKNERSAKAEPFFYVVATVEP